MNIRKIIAGVVACSVIGCSLPCVSADVADNAVVAQAASYTYGSLTYEIDTTNNYIYITGFDNSVANVVIPSSIEGIPVKSINKEVFKNASNLESIVISEGITDIGEKAFYNCMSLKSVTLPESLETIGESAFESCISLEKIYIPESVTSIGSYAFKDCAYLQTLEFPPKITSIPKAVAYGCSSLISVIINHGPTEIGLSAFAYCNRLKTVTLPLSITELCNSSSDWNSFYNCPVEEVYYAGSSLQWSKLKGDRSYLTKGKIYYEASVPPNDYDKGYSAGYEAALSGGSADVNKDGKTDAIDASAILEYYAYYQTGGSLSFEEYFKKYN